MRCTETNVRWSWSWYSERLAMAPKAPEGCRGREFVGCFSSSLQNRMKEAIAFFCGCIGRRRRRSVLEGLVPHPPVVAGLAHSLSLFPLPSSSTTHSQSRLQPREPKHEQTHYTHPPLRLMTTFAQHPHHHSMPPPLTAEDELLDLLASDTFSLESHRDRDILLLSSILQGALPTSSSPPSHGINISGTGPTSTGGVLGGGAGWNGWRPDASTSQQVYGSNSSGSYQPPAPSSSLQSTNNTLSSSNFPFNSTTASSPNPPTPHGTPLNMLQNLPSTTSPPTDQQTSRRYNTRSGARPPTSSASSGAFAPPSAPFGCRAPAVSRERQPAGMMVGDWRNDASTEAAYALPSYEASVAATSGAGGTDGGSWPAGEDTMMDD